MAGIKELRQHMKSVRDTLKITTAMHLMASSRFRRSRPKMAAALSYAELLEKALSRVLQGEPESWNGTLLVCLTTNKGLAGDFTKVTIKNTEKLLQEENLEMVMLGEAGRRFARYHDLAFSAELSGHLDDPSDEYAKALSELVLNNRGERRILLAYTGIPDGIHPEFRTKQLWPPVVEPESYDADYIPTRDAVRERLLAGYPQAVMKAVLLESYTAEQQARMLAMEAASDNARRLLDELTLSYNRLRQDMITREIIEVSGERQGSKA